MEEVTWKVEEEMQKKYPELLINQGENFKDEILLREREYEDSKIILYFILFVGIHFFTLFYYLNFLDIFISESRFFFYHFSFIR